MRKVLAMGRSKMFVLLCSCLTASTLLWGVETTFWQVATFEEFMQGTLRDVSLSKEGELTLAPESRAVFNPEEALGLSLASDRSGNLYIGTGHQGKVFRVDANLQGSLFFTAQESDIFALAVAPDGTLYVGSSPEGRIYKVTPEGRSTVFFQPKAKYIWALAFDSRGNLFAGTGDQGKILKIDPSGKEEVFYDTKQTHIMCLAFDRDGNLLAGSVPNGLVYRITPQSKAFVLYQASLPEIHDIATDADGRIYAAALGSAGGKGTPELFVPTVPVAPTSPAAVTVTVTAGTEAKPSAPSQTPVPVLESTAPSFGRPAPQTTGFRVPQLPQGRGSLIQILPDSVAETIWTSNSESLFGLAVRGNEVLFSTDSNGRIFSLTPRQHGQKLELLTQTQESIATRLLLFGQNVYIATSNVARLFRLGSALAREGTYESPVRDTKFYSRWGMLSWRARVPEGSALEFYSRSGNSDRPDATWSDWGGPYRNAGGSSIVSPPARYMQWKAVFRSTGNSTPSLDEVTVSYLNQNLPPQIRSLNVSTGSERTSPTGVPSTSAGTASSLSVTPTPSVGVATPPPPSGTSGRIPTTLSWQADDPNGDQLTYALYVKAADEEEWHLLKDKLRQTSYTIEPNAVADGKYAARLVASDEESNPPQVTRTAELLSAPFWIDSTPPAVRALKQRVGLGSVEIQLEVRDAISPLRRAEYAIDGKEWREIDSDDGIVDSREETFTLRAERIEPGEHIVTLRAYDTAGNAGVGKAVIRVPVGTGPGR